MLRRSCEQTTALQDKLKEKDEMIQEVSSCWRAVQQPIFFWAMK